MTKTYDTETIKIRGINCETLFGKENFKSCGVKKYFTTLFLRVSSSCEVTSPGNNLSRDD